MKRLIAHFACLMIISASVFTSGTCADTSKDFLHSNDETDPPTDGILLVDSIDQIFFKEKACNDSSSCQNGGTCLGGECFCPRDYEGPRCETPKWCSWGRCGFGSEVECVWDRTRKKGECRCKKENYTYLPKERKCLECDCGGHGVCQVVDDVLVCKCDKNYALKASKCEACDCGSPDVRCSFNAEGDKVCQCAKGYASKTVTWPKKDKYCSACDCGEHGKCSLDSGDKFCDCEAGYRFYRGKCIECDCGRNGICDLDHDGNKVCSCDYGFAEKQGSCQDCDCNYLLGQRYFGINCTFVDGLKHCTCPPGFETGSEYCIDINECYTSRSCPSNTVCINKPGTFECECEPGFKPKDSSLDPKFYGCEDIDECWQWPCLSDLTHCVNTPGSYDCVCNEGYYATSGTYGSSYRPAHNNCYETKTQWKAASIALGVILLVAIMGISIYIMKHRSSS